MDNLKIFADTASNNKTGQEEQVFVYCPQGKNCKYECLSICAYCEPEPKIYSLPQGARFKDFW